MTVLRRLDAVLEPTKQAVLDSKAALDSIGVVDQKTAFRRASGEAFYNTSEFSLKDLRAKASRQRHGRLRGHCCARLRKTIDITCLDSVSPRVGNGQVARAGRSWSPPTEEQHQAVLPAVPGLWQRGGETVVGPPSG